MSDEIPNQDEAAGNDSGDSGEAEAEAQLRADLQKQAAAFRALTDGLKAPRGWAKELKAFQAIDIGPLGEQFRKMEADREAVLESMIGPASRIQADIEALTASIKRPVTEADLAVSPRSTRWCTCGPTARRCWRACAMTWERSRREPVS